MVSVKQIEFKGWNCVQITNGHVELIVSTSVGPRILYYGFAGGENLFHLRSGDVGKTGGDEWRIYGGHRLWHAPEAMPRSYSPDNDAIVFHEIKNGAHFIQAKEKATGISKEIEVTISDDNAVTVLHRLINNNLWEVELAAWGLSVMAPNGRAIVPQEKYGEADVFLLPARPLALWHFTKMNDPRWIWGERYIQAVHDPAHVSEQKIGVANSLGWVAYWLNNQLMVKTFDFDSAATYCDFGCNNEIYMSGEFLEIETLGPLTKISPMGRVEHTERWSISQAPFPATEDDIDKFVLPVVISQQKS
ncbi:MAG: hypothetical protein JNK79_19360 [Chitinophagaceae bacterium]|nr:hypothetical protein [Chitinophagaceae bacterium]